MSFVKLAPIDGFVHCANCPPRQQEMALDTPLAIGFGEVTVTKDCDIVWSGDDPEVKLARFEAQALATPDSDWRVTIYGPLYEAIYQRHSEGCWVLVERGEGFA